MTKDFCGKRKMGSLACNSKRREVVTCLVLVGTPIASTDSNCAYIPLGTVTGSPSDETNFVSRRTESIL